MEEFFQLFKTPWEKYVQNRSYEAVIATDECIPQDIETRVLIIYSSCAIPFDDRIGVATKLRTACEWMKWGNTEFPVYGDLTSLQSAGHALLRTRETLATVGSVFQEPGRYTVRMGFDLFSEVAFLLRMGQPAENAHVPTLDIHVSLLRTMMVGLGIPLVEVPPAPFGFDFMTCLTHDVDFVGIRDHRGDQTMWGFLYRSLAGSLLRALRGRLTWSKCLQNWGAALSLPLVHLGLRKDFWLEFERYKELEGELGATFFFIPFKNVAGTREEGPAPMLRAAKYDVGAIEGQLLELVKSGCEVGLHGIDAWSSLQNAQAEFRRIQEITGQARMGTRMHWLYWTESSAKTLEDAGFVYDSTFGYNDAIGFRAGTTQAFLPYGANNLLELSLNIQDSAMLYSNRMGLSEVESLTACKSLIDSVVLYGGALTLNWHTRSLSPERLWGDCYLALLGEIKKHRAWFGTALQAVGWFMNRRALRFESVEYGEGCARVALSGPSRESKPSITLRVHRPTFDLMGPAYGGRTARYTDYEWNGETTLEIPYATPEEQSICAVAVS